MILNINYIKLLEETLNGRKNPFKNEKEYYNKVQEVITNTFYSCNFMYSEEEKRNATINNIKVAIELMIDERTYNNKKDNNTTIDYTEIHF
ncbi:Uncharacterised protein [Megamonas hypermegale]|uniref:Uncharacterized protein n=1 Tax=Megamonas hypermegale TaxID=158847 RepID=A0A378NTQ7_9FIRM|nr:hypothetical protein [Megamonas hypermegale]STY71256.1 Uncharacterised protein [Megamonas hypermegale]